MDPVLSNEPLIAEEVRSSLPAKPTYYPCLDGLRGMAVLLVLAAHAGFPGVKSGGVGVDVFFALSGFLITSILANELATSGSIQFTNFYARRFLRLMPCLWLTVSFFVLFASLIGTSTSTTLRESGFAVAYVMNWMRAFNLGGTSSLGHTWSLAIEEQFYLLWPVTLFCLCRATKSWTTRGVIIIALAAAIAIYRLWNVNSYSAARIYFGLDTHSDALMLGAALACFNCAGSIKLYGQSSFILGRFISPAAALILILIAIKYHWVNIQMAYFGFVLSGACAFLILLDLIINPASVLRVPLSIAPIRYVGKISYGLYLLHFPIYEIAARIGFVSGWFRLLAIGGSITFLVATVSYYLVERPFLKLKEHFVSPLQLVVPRPVQKTFGVSQEYNCGKVELALQSDVELQRTSNY
jgi:peptidoglycan/LPS O-acetylase OafA/YrhL